MTNSIQFLHLGLGAFHRAHQAVFIKQNIASVSMRKADVADALSTQGNKFEVIARDGSGETTTLVESIKEALFYPRDISRITEIAKSPDLKAITLTVTEKAYKNGGDDGVPDRIAFLLAERFKAGAPGIAIISCDNVPSNSQFLRGLVLEVVAANGESELLQWINKNIRFPNSMIDRIVPAMTSSAITTEPFNQWVIENDPISELFQGTGVEFVPEVKPHELAKIRLFNGVHSTLAYIGEVEGIEFVANAITHPVIAPFIKALQETEMVPSITDTGGIDLISYATTIRKRISNPTLRHRAHQIAMDGSQKMQQRIFDGANDLAKLGRPAPLHIAAVAIWVHFLATNSEIDDPLADKLTPLAKSVDALEAVVKTLSLEDFTRKLNPSYFEAVAKDLATIRKSSVLELLSNKIAAL
ncbi:MAG: mannitol dehydrogenase family protein [Actinomycetes bacterium]